MPDNKLDFSSLIKGLNDLHVKYVLIGGLAMVAHGSAIVTQDVDIGYARDRENFLGLEHALKIYHPRLRGVTEDIPFVLDSQTLRNTANLTLQTDIGPIDLLGEIPGVPNFDNLWKNSVTTEIAGSVVRIASLDDMARMKNASGRPKDKAHLLEIEELLKLRSKSGS